MFSVETESYNQISFEVNLQLHLAALKIPD